MGNAVADLARVLLMTPAMSFETRGEGPLTRMEVAPLGSEGVMLGFPMPQNGGKALLGIRSRRDFAEFAHAASAEATSAAKRFYKGDFALQVELPFPPTGTLTVGPIRGKRMVSFMRDGHRIFHAWCEGGVLHTLWTPQELADALGEVAVEIAQLKDDAPMDPVLDEA